MSDIWSMPNTEAVGNLSASDFGSGGGSSALSGLGALGGLGLGAGALGYLMSQGPSALPSEYGTLTGTQVPQLQNESTTLFGEGQQYLGQGAQALAMGQAGQLTPQQQAQLSLTGKGLQNKTSQMFQSMGRDPNQDTAALTQGALNQTQLTAMSQAYIQSTIQLGLAESNIGNALTGESLNASNQADQSLIAAGDAQLKSDQAYSQSLTSVFGAIGNMFPAILKMALA